MSNISILSVVVAALAVIVGAVMQFFTLRTTRRNTLAGLRAEIMESAISGLKTALAEHLTLTYTIDSNYRGFKYNDRPFPPDHFDLAKKEDQLFNLIRLHLAPNDPLHLKLLEALNELRNGDSMEIWTARRDVVIDRATAVFMSDRQKVLGEG
jgi:hypothetical protein